MHVFVTGATGWVGGAIVDELLGAGHRVTGLARSTAKTRELAAKGATVIEGSLDDLDLLARSARAADAVAHTAFNHDWTRLALSADEAAQEAFFRDRAGFAESAVEDERAILAMGEALVGTAQPLLVTSGLSGLVSGRLATEQDRLAPSAVRRSELAAQALAERGVTTATIRLAPSVHGTGETHGFVPMLVRLARDKGVSAYIGEGANRWAGVHRRDAARLFVAVLETGAPRPVYHAVADEGFAFRRIAEAIGRGLDLPAESRGADHFGWFARMVGGDMAGTVAATRAATGWVPTGPRLLSDLAEPSYYGD